MTPVFMIQKALAQKTLTQQAMTQKAMTPLTFNFDTFDHHAHITSINSVPTQATQFWKRISELSHQNQWILFTAQCPRPSIKQLTRFNTCSSKVIHMKASSYQSEFEIAIKAIQSGNASAVVVSSNIDEFGQRQLNLLAKKHQCEVFFTEHSSQVLH